jgi:hypothetical protein
MGERGPPIRNDLAAELSRREFMRRAGALGLGAVVLGAVPAVERLAAGEAAGATPNLADATLQAYFDTILPGRKARLTDLGNPIHPQAIAGADSEPGAVEADALLLARHPKIGFDALEGPLLAELSARSLPHGGDFLSLPYAQRLGVCREGLSFSNPGRVVWEAGAAVPFTAFCAAATQRNATRKTASGLRVMGHPGTAPHGYRNASFGRKLARERTRRGYLS